jgi:hypothetical protein
LYVMVKGLVEVRLLLLSSTMLLHTTMAPAILCWSKDSL